MKITTWEVTTNPHQEILEVRAEYFEVKVSGALVFYTEEIYVDHMVAKPVAYFQSEIWQSVRQKKEPTS